MKNTDLILTRLTPQNKILTAPVSTSNGDTYEITPPSSVRRHSLNTDASVTMAALDGGAPLNSKGE